MNEIFAKLADSAESDRQKSLATNATPAPPDRPPGRQPVGRAEQLEEYVDLLLDLDQRNPSDELHDRIERALVALRKERDDARERMVVYTVPLRAGAPFVQISLPMDLTAAEADRIAGVIRAVAFPDAS